MERSSQMPLRLENKMMVVPIICSLVPIAKDSLTGIMTAVVERLNRELRKNISPSSLLSGLALAFDACCAEDVLYGSSQDSHLISPL